VSAINWAAGACISWLQRHHLVHNFARHVGCVLAAHTFCLNTYTGRSIFGPYSACEGSGAHVLCVQLRPALLFCPTEGPLSFSVRLRACSCCRCRASVLAVVTGGEPDGVKRCYYIDTALAPVALVNLAASRQETVYDAISSKC